MILECIDCHLWTSSIESATRRFNTNLCGHCGGKLIPVPTTKCDYRVVDVDGVTCKTCGIPIDLHEQSR